MTYNFTPLQSNTSTIVDLVTVTNDASGGVIIFGFLFAVLIIQMITFYRFGSSFVGAIAFSSWLTFVYSLFLLIAGTGLINFQIVTGLGITAAISTMILYLSEK